MLPIYRMLNADQASGSDADPHDLHGLLRIACVTPRQATHVLAISDRVMRYYRGIQALWFECLALTSPNSLKMELYNGR